MQRFSKYYLFSLLFFISGLAGIIYESVWTQYLKLITGHAAFAQSFILVIFLSGMSAGAWFAGKWSSKIKNLFLFYALAELLIGLAALFFHEIFISFRNLIFGTFYPNLPVFVADLSKWAIAILITFPQSVLLGATFPLFTSAISRQFPKSKGRAVAQFYFVNSLGAAIGVLVSGFYLINRFGLPGTMVFAGLLNLIVAGVVLIFSEKSSVKNATLADEKAFEFKSKQKNVIIIFLVASFITGASSFIYEIGWIRMLSMVLGSSVQSFELMLSAFILGLAIGAFSIKFRIERQENLFSTFSVIQILMGLFAISSLVLYNYTFNLMEWLLGALQHDSGGYYLFTVSGQVLAYLIMLPATICAGMALPLLVRMMHNAGFGEQSVGKIFAADTAGGILGVLLAFHLLMPFLGLKFLIVFAGMLDIGVGAWFLYRFDVILFRKKWPALGFLFVAILAFTAFFGLDPVKMASGVYRYGMINHDNKILFHKDGKTATIAVYETKNGNVVLSANGKPDASINLYRKVSGDLTTQVLLAALPFSLFPNPENAAIIGLGSGKTAHVTLMNYHIRQLDVIEIEPAVADASVFFKEQVQNIFNDPRYKLHIADARTFFATATKKYDLIISEPSNPWISGVAGMFSYEFYQSVSASLTAEGIFVQLIHTYEMNMQLLASVFKAISPVFEEYQVYYLDDGDLAIVARKNGRIGGIQAEIFENPEIKFELKRLGIESKNDLIIRYVGNKKLLDPLFGRYAVTKNSDFYPYLEYNAGKARFLSESVDELMELITFPAPVLRTLNGLTLEDNFETGPNYVFEIAEEIKTARTIFKYFKSLTSGEKPEISGLNDYDALILNTILTINHETDHAVIEKVWNPVLELFAAKIIPYLSPVELALIWDYLQNCKSYSLISPKMKIRFAHYQAVSLLDFERIIKITDHFFGDRAILPLPENYYLLATAMWANIMLEKPEEAARLLKRVENQEESTFMLRFLSSITNERLILQQK
jgi:predicted membrane-bound spermidine synthase